jgi:hypothetical protein
MTRYPGFIDGSNEQSSYMADTSRTVNMMPRIIGATGKNQTVLVGTPGLTLLEEIVSGDGVRGIFEGDLIGTDYYYVAVDNYLYKSSINGDDTTLLGSIDGSPNSPSASPSNSPSPSVSESPSASPSPSASESPSTGASPSLSPSPSVSESPSSSPSESFSSSVSPSPSISESPSLSPSPSVSVSPSASPSEPPATTACIRWATGDNTLDTLIISNGAAYQLVSGSLSAISDLVGITCLDCAYIGGYFVVITDEYVFRISGIGDITSWDPLDYDYPDVQPEPLVGVISNNGQLWFFGKTRTSVWMLDPTVDFGMSRVKGINIQFGCWSPYTLHIFDNGIVWLASTNTGTGRVCIARNYAPTKVSTHYVDTVITDNVEGLGEAYAIIMENQGNEVYQLSIPGASTSLCLDASTQRWHERGYWTGSDFQLHLAKSHMAKNGVHYIGGRNSGNVYTSSMDMYDDNGEAIRRMRRAPHVHDESKDLTYYKFQLDMEKGLGTDGSNPMMYMRYSRNGGKTYSTAIGSSVGETDDDVNTIRVEWNRLGSGRDHVFEVYSDVAIRHCWTDAYLRVK